MSARVYFGTRENFGSDETIRLLASRYKAAYAEYQCIVDLNCEITLSGDRPSIRALVEEERAFEELDAARHALLAAAARAYPTIH